VTPGASSVAKSRFVTRRHTRRERLRRRHAALKGAPLTESFIATLASDFASGMRAADAKRPIAVSQRAGGASYKPGLGPHTEAKTIDLVLAELRQSNPTLYGNAQTNVPNPNMLRQRCDLVLDCAGGSWYVEAKMMRLMGDNGKPNDNILTHILSPYPLQRSALTDCEKLLKSGFQGRYAILIFGYEYPGWPLEPVMSAFECLARGQVALSTPAIATFDQLVHPIHSAGAVYVWEISKLEN
jgi:hypothetical protein